MKGSWVAFVFRSGKGKRGGGIKAFSLGDALKPRILPFTLLFETEMDFSGGGAKIVFVLKLILLNFVPVFFFSKKSS